MLNLKGEVVNELSDVQLSEISGGGKSGANTFLAGAAGAGAIAGIVLPHELDK